MKVVVYVITKNEFGYSSKKFHTKQQHLCCDLDEFRLFFILICKTLKDDENVT